MTASSTTETSTPGGSRALLNAIVPIAAGVIVALVVGAQAGVGPVIMVCAAIYLFAAAIGRRWGAWLGFGASFAVIAPGAILDAPWISLVALTVIQVALVVVGFARGAWRSRENRLQLLGALVFGAIAVAATLGAPPWAAIAVVTGLAAHGAWDLWHHRRDVVVMRSYALFCAALDFALAAFVLVALVIAGQ
jgi:hypothetical protein